MGIVVLEIITPMPTFFSHCPHCETMLKKADINVNEEIFSSYPKDLQEDYFKLCSLAGEVQKVYGEKLSIRVIDPMSIEGIFKCIKYWSTKFPLFVVNGEARRTGWLDQEELKDFLDRHIDQ